MVMDERRAILRREIRKEAKVWMPHGPGVKHCIVEDMNLRGMRVSFDRRLLRQHAQRMSFAIRDNSEFINTEAQILWTREERDRYIYGLAFNKMEVLPLMRVWI
jgi:hypothetical protein